MSTVNPLDVLESVRAGRISQADGIALLSIDAQWPQDVAARVIGMTQVTPQVHKALRNAAAGLRKCAFWLPSEHDMGAQLLALGKEVDALADSLVVFPLEKVVPPRPKRVKSGAGE